MVLHGKGLGNFEPGSQIWFTEKYEKKRRKGMQDKDKLTTSERLLYEISGSEGEGMTNYKNYIIKQNPFPVDNPKKKIDVRTFPQVGE